MWEGVSQLWPLKGPQHKVLISLICLYTRLGLLALWKIPEYQVIIIIVIIFRDEMFHFLVKIIKLFRKAEHSNFKYSFSIRLNSAPWQAVLFAHQATSIQSINNRCRWNLKLEWIFLVRIGFGMWQKTLLGAEISSQDSHASYHFLGVQLSHLGLWPQTCIQQSGWDYVVH